METYGEIRYTIGQGGSGGALLQHLIADAYPGLPPRFWRNAGGGRFVEATREAGLERPPDDPGKGLGAIALDVEGHGDLDLYVANDTNPNRLYENVAWPGGVEADPAGLGFRFEERAAPAGLADANSGMGLAAGDYDGDGLTDLFVTNARRQTHGVFRSRPGGKEFGDVRADLGATFSGSTGWGVSWADLDLDTELDLVLVNGHIPVTDLAALGPQRGGGGRARPMAVDDRRDHASAHEAGQRRVVRLGGKAGDRLVAVPIRLQVPARGVEPPAPVAPRELVRIEILDGPAPHAASRPS